MSEKDLEKLHEKFSTQYADLKNVNIDTIEKGKILHEAFLVDLEAVIQILEILQEKGIK